MDGTSKHGGAQAAVSRHPRSRWVVGACLLLPALGLLFSRLRLGSALAPWFGTERRAVSILDLLMWVLITAASFTAPQAKRIARLLLLGVVIIYLVAAVRNFL